MRATIVREISMVLDRALVPLLAGVASQAGRAGSGLRRQVGDLRANLGPLLSNGEFASSVLDCFTAARKAGVGIRNFDQLISTLGHESPVNTETFAVIYMAMSVAMSQEARIVSTMSFTSRDDVEAMQSSMNKKFDVVKSVAADGMNSTVYANMIQLAASVSNFLADVGRPLPRMVDVELPKPLPALTAAQFVYGAADNWEDVVAENKIVHPAFVRRDIRVLGVG